MSAAVVEPTPGLADLIPTPQALLEEQPYLEPEDVQQALEYAAWLAREEVRQG